MYIDLRKTLRSVENCLPEDGVPAIKQLYSMYDQVLRLRSQLLSVIYDRETFGGAKHRESIAKHKSNGINDGAIVTLTFDEPLPSMKELTAAVEEHWLAMIQEAVHKGRQENPLPYFAKAFVWIEIVSPRGTNHAKVWDTSNRAINVIINNLKGVFFRDDDMEHMAFGVAGSWGETGSTIVRILSFEGKSMSF